MKTMSEWDFSIFNPEGKKFRSTVEVKKYIENKSEITCDQKVRNNPYIMSVCFWPLWTQPTHLIGKIQHFYIPILNMTLYFFETPPIYFVFFFFGHFER